MHHFQKFSVGPVGVELYRLLIYRWTYVLEGAVSTPGIILVLIARKQSLLCGYTIILINSLAHLDGYSGYSGTLASFSTW